MREKLSPEDFAAFAQFIVPQGFEPTPDPLGLSRAIADTFPILTKRIENALESKEIRTLRQLVTKSEAEMLGMPGFGRKSLNELKELLASQGLHFGWLE